MVSAIGDDLNAVLARDTRDVRRQVVRPGLGDLEQRISVAGGVIRQVDGDAAISLGLGGGGDGSGGRIEGAGEGDECDARARDGRGRPECDA
ncbi:MAG: hypothetical protein H6811_09810 [Phycisphaeraceae bacterium]|nr:hypothetical protein [Phycisphaeraceae bacterium]